MTDHPITPPPELVEQWLAEARKKLGPYHEYVATQAARWGSDQELEACCAWTAIVGGAEALRAARRPKPPSLAEEALAALEEEDDSMPLMSLKRGERFTLIRRALERLQELEGGDD